MNMKKTLAVLAAGLMLLAEIGRNQWEFLNTTVIQKTFLVSKFLMLGKILP